MDYDMSQAFAQRLRDFRLVNNLTKRELADILGIRDFAIDAWERGQHIPSSLTQKGTWVILKKFAHVRRSFEKSTQ